MRSVPNQSATPFLHIAETDCVAGVIGLELRNPLGSKSARFAGGFPVDLAETAQPRRFAFELRVEDMQLRQGFRLALPARRLAQHDGGAVQYARLVGFELGKSQRK